MNQLYPLKFTPILKDKIWGGSKLKNILNKPTDSNKAGESWEISAVQDDISVVSDGFLAGNNLEELIEIYMGDLVGQKVYEKFGVEFPLLIKFIDATDDLSIQVHPNDEVAKKRHNSYGKTEMWYVMQAEKSSKLVVGFNKEVTKEQYIEAVDNGTLLEILNDEVVSAGDVFFLPAGRIHAIGAGILLAEIQQTSDITYRIYDYQRKDAEGNYRELHTELAVDVNDYSVYDEYKTNYISNLNESSKVVSCNYFTTNLLELDKDVEKDYNKIDSFVIYMCLHGEVKISCNGCDDVVVKKGQTVMVPAEIENFILSPSEKSKLIEVYIDKL